MNINTFEIREVEQITKEEFKSGKWVHIPKEHLLEMQKMNRKDRRKYMKEHGLFKILGA